MSGLGKLRPNLMLIGFKNNWQDSNAETREYFKVIQSAFEINLSVAILRVSGGHSHTSSCSEVTSHIHTSKSVTSMDSGMDDMIRDSSPPPSPQSQISSHPTEPSIRIKKSFLNQLKMMKEKKKKETAENNKCDLTKNLTQFRNEEQVKGLYSYDVTLQMHSSCCLLRYNRQALVFYLIHILFKLKHKRLIATRHKTHVFWGLARPYLGSFIQPS